MTYFLCQVLAPTPSPTGIPPIAPRPIHSYTTSLQVLESPSMSLTGIMTSRDEFEGRATLGQNLVYGTPDTWYRWTRNSCSRQYYLWDWSCYPTRLVTRPPYGSFWAILALSRRDLTSNSKSRHFIASLLTHFWFLEKVDIKALYFEGVAAAIHHDSMHQVGRSTTRRWFHWSQ